MAPCSWSVARNLARRSRKSFMKLDERFFWPSAARAARHGATAARTRTAGLATLGHYDRKVSELPSPKAKFSGKPHISGTRGGHTINLHQFARDGLTLLGRLTGVRAGIVTLARDLHDNLAAADRAEAEFVNTVDAYVVATGMTVSDETLPALRDGFA